MEPYTPTKYVDTTTFNLVCGRACFLWRQHCSKAGGSLSCRSLLDHFLSPKVTLGSSLLASLEALRAWILLKKQCTQMRTQSGYTVLFGKKLLLWWVTLPLPKLYLSRQYCIGHAVHCREKYSYRFAVRCVFDGRHDYRGVAKHHYTLCRIYIYYCCTK